MGTILHVSSCHVETPPVPVTATQPATQPQSPIMTTQQSPIETVVATTISANQSLCEVDSDTDILQNTNSNGKLENAYVYTHTKVELFRCCLREYLVSCIKLVLCLSHFRRRESNPTVGYGYQPFEHPQYLLGYQLEFKWGYF